MLERIAVRFALLCVLIGPAIAALKIRSNFDRTTSLIV